MKYFTNVKTLDELKKEYRRLLMLHHPDRGGDTGTKKAKRVYFPSGLCYTEQKA